MSAPAEQLPVADWDPSRDLLVFIGPANHAELRRLCDAGQVHFIVLDPGYEGATESSPNTGAFCRNLQQLRDAVEQLKPPYPQHIHCLDETGGAVDEAFIVAVGGIVERRLCELVSAQATRQHFAPRWRAHLQTNRAQLKTLPRVSDLDDCCRGRLALVTSGGPSLTGALPTLRAHGRNALIIAELRAAQAMVTAGIAPDLVLLSDAGIRRADLEPLDRCPQAYLVIEAGVDPQLLQYRPGRTVFFAGNQLYADELRAEFGRGVCLENGGSVSNCAFSLAHRLGCNPIALVGQDLALHGEGQRYAEGAGGRENPHRRKLIQVKTVSGTLGWTHPDLQNFRKWLQSRASQLAGQRRLYNTSPTGAAIRGFEAVDLESLLRRYTNAEPRELDRPSQGLDVEPVRRMQRKPD